MVLKRILIEICSFRGGGRRSLQITDKVTDYRLQIVRCNNHTFNIVHEQLFMAIADRNAIMVRSPLTQPDFDHDSKTSHENNSKRISMLLRRNNAVSMPTSYGISITIHTRNYTGKYLKASE